MVKNRLDETIRLLYIVCAVGLIVVGLVSGDYYSVSQVLIALAMVPIPAIVNKVFKIKLQHRVISIYYIFCMLSITCGSGLRWYSKVPGWDKLLHFLSGFLIALVGLALFNKWKTVSTLNTKVDYLFLALYTISFTLAGAVLWEFYEYALYVFLEIDAVNVLTTGIHDTMQDMIVCGLGGSLTVMWMIRQIKKQSQLKFLNIWS